MLSNPATEVVCARWIFSTSQVNGLKFVSTFCPFGLFPYIPAMQQPQALTRRDFASEADWEEYQASGMAPRQAEGRAKVVRGCGQVHALERGMKVWLDAEEG